jgi:hypothetical protein
MTQPITEDMKHHNLDAADAMMGQELARHDTKASLLIAIDGGTLALLTTIVHGLNYPVPVLAIGTAGITAMVASILLLLCSIRPRLSGASGEGWELWARMERDALATHMIDDRRPERVVALSRLIRSKYVQLQRAVDLLLVGLFLIALSVLVAATIK